MRRCERLILISLLLSAAVASNSLKSERAQAANPGLSQVARATAGDRQSIAQNERQKSAGTTGATAKTRVDACSLLKSDELLAIQGEAIRETKLSESASGSLATQQCLYILQTYSKSLSLSLTQRDSSKGEGVKLKEFWEEKFRAFEEEEEREKGGNRGERSAKEAEREREKKRDAARGESSRQDKERDEEEEESKPVRVPGVGEEAFWVGNRMLGALYVFSKNSILRLSLGGPEDEAAKIIKLKALAQKAIKRL